MLRAYSLRYILVAALFFAFGTVQVGVAATTAFDQQLHRQDVGDDDGDGILNYQDPDDNNDGILDKDTPAPTAVPPISDLDEDNPDNDSVVDNETNQELTPEPVTTPDESTDTDGQTVQEEAPVVEIPVVEEAQAAPVAQQVTSLPDTGAGLDDSSSVLGNASMILTLLLTAVVAANLNSKNRMS